MMVDSSFGYTVRAFIAKDAFVTWDPDEFNVKRIQGREKIVNVAAEQCGCALGWVCSGVCDSCETMLGHSGDHIGPTRTTAAVSPARQLGVHAGTPFWSVGARGLGIGDERAKVYGLSAEFASTGH